MVIEILRKGVVRHSFKSTNECFKLMRKESGLTQKQVGATMGVSPQRIHYIENNVDSVGFRALLMLAGVYNYEMSISLIPKEGKSDE